MRREILFKAKRISGGEWIEGFLFRTENRAYIAYQNQFDDDLFLSPKEIFIEVDHETICQYTGRVDGTGKKIFEGDIFPYHFNSAIVGGVRFGKYRNPFNDDAHGGHVGFYVDWGKQKDRFRADLAYWIKVSEVKGNIFDNPELLEGNHAAGD